jgi:hypothetical protein
MGAALRVLVNGKPRGDLDARLERELRVKRVIAVAEGIVLTPEQALGNAKRRMTLLYGVAFGVAGLIVIAALIAAAAYEPRDLIVFVPLVLIMGVGLAVLLRFVWRRNVAAVVKRAAATDTAPGVPVRVEDAGLSIGAETFPWNAIAVDELGVVRISSEDSTTEAVDRLTLSSGGRVVVLDALTISNGAVVVGQAWRHLCAHRVAL